MDSTPPVAVLSPYPSRRGWLIAFGVIEILIGCAFVLMILFSAFAFFGLVAAKMPSGAMSSGPISRPALMAFVGLQYGLMAAVFFTGGIGSIRCKNWARILMLVVSGLWLACGLLGTLMMAFIFPAIMKHQPGNIPPGLEHAIVAVMIAVMTVLMVLLPAIFLFFYSRKSVRATCLALVRAQVATPGTAGSPASGLPVPLAILGVWEGLGALSVLATLFIRVAVVFGVVLHGVAAFLVILTYSALSGYAAWAILRQKLIGWQIALFTAGFWTISMVASFVRIPDQLQMLKEIGYSDQALRIYEQFPQFSLIIRVGTAVMMTALLVFLLYTRKYFPAGERA
ncbi:MAG: hypothetical protein ABSG32_22635 [Terriglobia bacterium]|jgi:hypothetical protein